MTTHLHRFDPDEHARIFGASQERATGRSRLCKSCGDWHRLDRPWPHNCREPAPPRSDLAAPQIAPVFSEFVFAKGLPDATEIGDRKASREFMARNGFIEHEPGIAHKDTWVDEKTERASIIADIKRSMEEDPINRRPLERVGEADLGVGAEISTEPDAMETV